MDPTIRQGDFATRLGRERPIASRADLFEAHDPMATWTPSSFLTPLVGELVVVDLKSSFVCLGTLVACDEQYLELKDADFHDFRDSPATREIYVYDSARFGIRRNRSRVLVRQDEVVAVTRFSDIAAS